MEIIQYVISVFRFRFSGFMAYYRVKLGLYLELVLLLLVLVHAIDTLRVINRLFGYRI